MQRLGGGELQVSGPLFFDLGVSCVPCDGIRHRTTSWPAQTPLPAEHCGYPSTSRPSGVAPFPTYDQHGLFGGQASVHEAATAPRTLLEPFSRIVEQARVVEYTEPPRGGPTVATWAMDHARSAGSFEAARTDRVFPWDEEADRLEAEQLEERHPAITAANAVLPDPVGTNALRQRRTAQRLGADEAPVPPDVKTTTEVEEAELQRAAVPNSNKDAVRARQLADRVLRKLEYSRGHHGRDRRTVAADLRHLAFTDQVSSRAAQAVLTEASRDDLELLASGLHGYVRKGMESLYANYVIQKVVEIMPSSFVAEELTGVGASAARHRFGCRIICRLLEHGDPSDPSTARLYDEILAQAEELCDHTFGSYVVGHFLEFGLPEHRRRVAHALRANLYGNAESKRGSRVVEAALKLCSPEDRRVLAVMLLADGERLLALAEGQFGCHVVKALLRMPGEHQLQVVMLLRPVEGKLRASRYGKFVVQTMESL